VEGLRDLQGAPPACFVLRSVGRAPRGVGRRRRRAARCALSGATRRARRRRPAARSPRGARHRRIECALLDASRVEAAMDSRADVDVNFAAHRSSPIRDKAKRR
ncbi:hypothetical protein, partial [Burkholderia pseudomallei]|uniref:hypothetical protein n=1 Tax=Burkholderia pseudomallei TaxID=28450 RepID=UPI001588C645